MPRSRIWSDFNADSGRTDRERQPLGIACQYILVQLTPLLRERIRDEPKERMVKRDAFTILVADALLHQELTRDLCDLVNLPPRGAGGGLRLVARGAAPLAGLRLRLPLRRGGGLRLPLVAGGSVGSVAIRHDGLLKVGFSGRAVLRLWWELSAPGWSLSPLFTAHRYTMERRWKGKRETLTRKG